MSAMGTRILNHLILLSLFHVAKAEHVATLTMDLDQASKMGIMTGQPDPDQDRSPDPSDPMPTPDPYHEFRQCINNNNNNNGYVVTRTVYIRQPVTVYVPTPVYISSPTSHGYPINPYPGFVNNGIYVPGDDRSADPSADRSGSDIKPQVLPSSLPSTMPEHIVSSLGSSGAILAVAPANLPQQDAANRAPQANANRVPPSNPVSNQALAEAVETYQKRYQEVMANSQPRPQSSNSTNPQQQR